MKSVIRYKNYAEIDLSALVSNFSLLCENAKKYSPDAKPICVLKADAYGHGACECASALLSAGADFFAVSDIGEALQLREQAPEAKILILGYVMPENAPLLSEYSIIQTVHSYEYAKQLNDAITDENVKISIHIKLDTGMSRLGFDTDGDLSSSLCDIERILSLPHLSADGVFSHFACADDYGSEMTDEQISRFRTAVKEMKKLGFSGCAHLSNSAGSMRFGALGGDYFRLGIALYGFGAGEVSLSRLLPVMRFFATVAQVKTVKKGSAISYGATYRAKKDIRVATVTVGYADGLVRKASGASLIINGKKAKILGRVCMDQCILSVDGIDVKAGDAVQVYDETGENTHAMAKHIGTIEYELLCLVGKRVPRIYKRV